MPNKNLACVVPSPKMCHQYLRTEKSIFATEGAKFHSNVSQRVMLIQFVVARMHIIIVFMVYVCLCVWSGKVSGYDTTTQNNLYHLQQFKHMSVRGSQC